MFLPKDGAWKWTCCYKNRFTDDSYCTQGLIRKADRHIGPAVIQSISLMSIYVTQTSMQDLLPKADV